MKNLSEELKTSVQEMLTATEGGADLYEKLVSEVAEIREEARTEKTRGVKASSELNDIRERYDMLAGLLTENGINLDDIAGSLSTIKKPAKATDGDDSRIKELTAKVNDFESKYNDALSKISNYQQKDKENKLVTKLQSAFKGDDGEFTHYGVTPRIKELLYDKNVELSDSGEVLWVEDGNYLPFDAGFKKYLERSDVKSDLKNKQKPGGGSDPADGNPTQQPDREAIRQKARARILQGI